MGAKMRALGETQASKSLILDAPKVSEKVSEIWTREMAQWLKYLCLKHES